MISTPELLHRIGCKASKTLKRWADLGLIPQPKMRPHPSGRGRLGYFEPWVLERCLDVRRRLGDGQRLEEIAKTLPPVSHSKRQIAPRPRRDARLAAENYRKWQFARAAEAFADAVTVKVMLFLRGAGIQRPGIGGKLYDEMRKPDFVRRVLANAKEPHSPIIVIFRDRIEVRNDSSIATAWKAEEDQGAFCVVPLQRKLYSALQAIEKEWAESRQRGVRQRVREKK